MSRRKTARRFTLEIDNHVEPEDSTENQCEAQETKDAEDSQPEPEKVEAQSDVDHKEDQENLITSDVIEEKIEDIAEPEQETTNAQDQPSEVTEEKSEIDNTTQATLNETITSEITENKQDESNA
jgi:hypothetical protein